MEHEDKSRFFDKLYSVGEKTARQNKPDGAVRSRSLADIIDACTEKINSAYEKVESRFGSSSSVPGACEWLLDNRYLAVREARSAKSAVRENKYLRACGKDCLILSACLSLSDACGGELSEDKCRAFFEGFQSVNVLSQNELSLLPAVLRIAVLSELGELCHKLSLTSSPETLTGRISALFSSLRFLGGLDPAGIIRRIDVCEKLLMSDPAGVYPEMDEQSRSYYRERLSYLAEKNAMSEHELARLILKKCESGEGCARHVGYHLITEPVGMRKKAHGGGLYIAANVLFTLFLSVLCGFLSHSAAAAFLLLLPLSELTKSLLDYIILLSVSPRRTPRLDFTGGIPEGSKTVCVISALIDGKDSLSRLCRRIEEFYLAERGGDNLNFGILADLPEAKSAVTEADAAILHDAELSIKALNDKYGGGFYLFTRARSFDPGSGSYCGFERKRGAVFALAAMLCGKKSELKISAGSEERLRGTRYIITLDSDTTPTPGSLTELAGAISHPLVSPVLDRESGCVVSGHGIIHPRMSYELSSVGKTDFSRIFACQGGIEPYSVLCGELYYDLFDRGGFSGKGIIDAECLYVCTDTHIPDGLILSHDAPEGAYLRGGYLSDTEFSDSFPSSPVAYYRRTHRWTRGDWQNSGMIFKKSSALPDIERFKLFDSLRRSLVAPMTFAALFLGFVFSEHVPAVAAWAAFLALASQLSIALAEYACVDRKNSTHKYHSRLFKGVGAAFLQTFIRLLLLPYEAYICISAALTSLWRMNISGKKLLEWETAAQSERKKRSILNYFRNMWFAVFSGLALIFLSASIIGNAAGLIWIISPLAAFALTFPAKKEKELSDNDREFLLSCAGGIWAYFDKFCSADDNFLPPDNFQEQPPVGIAHRTSPTNIGFALVSAVCAYELGTDTREKLLRFIENMLTTLERMPKYKGHFFNWYDTRTLRPLEPKYVSSVDCGNLYASLTVLQNKLTQYGYRTAAQRVESLMLPMDFSMFYDPKRGLIRIGIRMQASDDLNSCYDLFASESRLTSFIAVSKGDVPRKHWRRLSRAMRSSGGYKGMASWTGTMFEYLMPELFLPLSPDSLIFETAKYCLFVQKRRKSQTGLWGISESAFFSLDPALSFRYKAHGCSDLALKRGQDAELVISPYSSFLALIVDPQSAVKNLRRIKETGAVGRFGFIEAIDFTAARCRKNDGEQVRSYMAHHLGMSMIALTNCLKDGVIIKSFMSSPCMSAHRCLLEEKLPIDSQVLRLSEQKPAKPDASSERQWALRGEGVSFEAPECAVLSNGRYNVMLTESGASLSSCGDMLVIKPPYRELGDGHGVELVFHSGERSISLLPEPETGADFIWELNELCCSYSVECEEAKLISSVAVAGSENGELRFAEICAKRDIDKARIVLSFEPVLADYSDYVNHPAYWRLGIEAKSDGNCLMLRRLKRARQDEAWLCLACDKRMVLHADRNGGLGSLSAPFVTASLNVSLKAGERFNARFAVCVGKSFDEAFCGAQRMLAIGPTEYGAMPSVCAAVTEMDAREVSAAMSMIKHLWFTRTRKNAPAKRELWSLGLSGDMPIILCPNDRLSAKVAVSLTKQFCLLRVCGVFADLVFTCDEGGEYHRPIYAAVRDTLALHGLESLLGSHGGIRLLPNKAQSLIASSAAYTCGDKEPERKTGAVYPVKLQEKRQSDTVPEYGFGRDNTFVFYVNQSLPPRVWSNVLTNGRLSYLACDCGCGNMWYDNAHELKLSPFLNDPYATEGPETLEYISSEGRYSVFAASDGIPCRVSFGHGFAVWEKSFGEGGIKCSAFIPNDVDARVLIIELYGKISGQLAWKNEIQLAESRDDQCAVSVGYVNSVFRAQSPRSYDPKLCLKAAFSESVLGWTCDLYSWMRGDFDGKTQELSAPVFGVVIPCAPVSVIVCGVCDDEALLSLCKPEAAFDALRRTREHWQKSLMRLKLFGNTPMSHYVNGWAQYQTLACRILARGSLYQSGGAFGFRDQLQDAVNLILLSPEIAKRQILLCCAHQYSEGDVMHWWHTMPEGDKGVRTRCSDDLLWLPWALCEYVEKTGDSSICEELIRYVNSRVLSQGEHDRYETPAVSDTSESVLAHAKRAVDLSIERGTGMHGLLLFGSSDWNDGMDNIGGESVWLSWFFAHTVKRFSELLMSLCKPNADYYRAAAEKAGSAADSAWDSDHYLRGYWRDGAPLGSNKSDCCQIDSVAQSWAAFCADASNSRIDTALETALSKLYDRENGIVRLLTPPFYASSRYPGYIESYGPGFRENGGQYTHAAIWLAMACFRRGRINDGWQIMCDLIPEESRMKRYMAEPFVLSADVYSNEEHSGEAGWTWYTGSSGWYFRVFYEEVLGLKLWAGSLYIRPKLPEGFGSCLVKWEDKAGKVHEIRISGDEILTDGEKYDGKGIPYV